MIAGQSAISPSTDDAKLRVLRQVDLVIGATPAIVQDDLVGLAAELVIPICAVTVAGLYFQHVKAAIGTDLSILQHEHAFCRHTMMQTGVTVVNDASKDPRFAENPYVVKGPQLRFYAGAPLRTADGQQLGALCVMDTRPRTLSASGRESLVQAAAVIGRKLRFLEEGAPLADLPATRLLDLIRLEPASNRERLVTLVEALYDRLDRPS